MSFWLAILIGALFAAATYLMLRRSLVRLILGIALLAHAVNLLVFVAGGVVRGQPPILSEGQATMDPTRTADPLPQALVLTAIVIGFGILSYTLVLFHTAYKAIGTDDPDALQGREE